MKNGTTKYEKIIKKLCLNCKTINEGSRNRCSECGFLFVD